MGLLDVLNGMQNGPRGAPSSGGGGMSPLTMALLGLIAYKAVKTFSGSGQPSTGNGAPGAPSAGTAPSAGGGLGGGLGGLLQSGLGSLLGGGAAGGGLGNLLGGGAAGGGLGSLLGGGAAGGVLSEGLNDIVKQFEQNGQGDVVKSWVGSGPNKTISPDDLGNALGADRVNAMMAHSGMSRDDLLNGLSQQLPGLIDHLTPQGRVPTEQEAAHLV